MKWIGSVLAGAITLIAGSALADEPWRPAQVWLVYEWEADRTVTSQVSVLNISAGEARVSCHVYTESGVRHELASQTKTYAAGASRSNEGGALPCGFSFAGARRGWAVLSSPTPVIVRAERCQGGVCAPLEVRPLDCSAPAALESACRHAPPTLLLLPDGVRERLRDPGLVPRPRD
jgi:hypothetical protein